MGTKCKRCGKGYGVGEPACPHCGLSNPFYTPPPSNDASLGGENRQKYREEAEDFMRQACRESGIPANDYLKVARMFKELDGHHLGESIYELNPQMRQAVNILIPDDENGMEPMLGSKDAA